MLVPGPCQALYVIQPTTHRCPVLYITVIVFSVILHHLFSCLGHSFFLHSSEFLSGCQFHNHEGRP